MITFAEILNFVAKFRKDSIFRVKIFAKMGNFDEIFGAATLSGIAFPCLGKGKEAQTRK